MYRYEIGLGIRFCDLIDRGSSAEKRKERGNHPVGRLLDQIRYAQAVKIATQTNRETLDREIELAIDKILLMPY